MDGSTGLTCVTCRVVFENPELQRDHYRTEWHRYNLKRQAAELPAIDFETFSEKVQSFSTTKDVQPKKESQPLYCKACRKQIKTENAMNDHLASKKHKEMEKNLELNVKKGPKQPRKKVAVPAEPVEAVEAVEQEDEEDSEGWETDEEDQEAGSDDYNESDSLPVTNCLFCPQTKPTMEKMREHMHKHHDFILPDKQYLIDEEGVLSYLGLKVGAGRYCVFCPDRKARFSTIENCQKHMRDKQHCKLRRDTESMIELADFYDYGAMYGNDDENGETINDGWTLTLPSGAQIGHRHLFRYFKQYIRPVDGRQRLISQAALEKARGLYPALTWTGTGNVVQAKKVARDMKFIERFRRRVDLRVAVKSNKLFKTRGFVGDNH